MLKPILWPVLIPSLLFAMGAGAILPILVLSALSLGASASFAAVIVGLMGAVSLLATVPAGMLIDRLGDFRAMLFATITAILVLGAAIAAFLWDSPFSLLLFAAALMVFAPVTDVWNLARQAVVAEVMPSRNLAKAMTALGGSQRVGNLVGPIIGAGLMAVFPMWSVFAFAAVAGIAAVIVMALPVARLPEPGATRAPGRQAEDRRTEDPRPESQLSEGARDREEPTGTRGHAHSLNVRWTAVILAGISIVTLTLARSAQPVIVQLWGVEIGLHGSQISLLIAFGAGLELVLMFLGGYLKDRLGRVTTLAACLVIFGCGFVLLVILPSSAGMIAAVAVMAAGNGLGAGVNMTIGADLSPATGRARFLGIWAVFSNSGKLAGPGIVALLIITASLRIGVLAAGLLAIAGAVWVVAWSSRIGLPGRQR